MDVFNLKGPIPLDGNGISERSFLFKVENDQSPVMCTLATLPFKNNQQHEDCDEDSDEDDDCPYLENLILNRVGITSILVALPVQSTL